MLTRRAALMDAQVEILDGKRKSLIRLGEVIDEHARLIEGADDPDAPVEMGDSAPHDEDAAGALSAKRGKGRRPATDAALLDDGAAPPAVTRIVMTAQEDLRREIARAMHDGPAQSLTNIVLQAEIVERLVAKDPSAADGELRQLVAMVQHTLEATKAFIFDVRPMVLDDLGLVPTLRRAARDRGRRAGTAVEFESLGVDQRLPVDLESGLFRIIDEALGAYLAAKPERVALRLDWAEALDLQLSASRTALEAPVSSLPAQGGDMPAALAAMVEERREAEVIAVESARRSAVVQLPKRTWRDLSERAATLGIKAELLDEGGRLRLVAPLRDTAASPVT
ncbi:MAG: histidine kinase [Candidatus Limnocylindrales bacterium]